MHSAHPSRQLPSPSSAPRTWGPRLPSLPLCFPRGLLFSKITFLCFSSLQEHPPPLPLRGFFPNQEPLTAVPPRSLLARLLSWGAEAPGFSSPSTARLCPLDHAPLCLVALAAWLWPTTFLCWSTRQSGPQKQPARDAAVTTAMPPPRAPAPVSSCVSPRGSKPSAPGGANRIPASQLLLTVMVLATPGDWRCAKLLSSPGSRLFSLNSESSRKQKF